MKFRWCPCCKNVQVAFSDLSSLATCREEIRNLFSAYEISNIKYVRKMRFIFALETDKDNFNE